MASKGTATAEHGEHAQREHESAGKSPLNEKLAQHFRQPLELFPWLMIMLLFLFVVENYLANRFYRKS